MLKVHLVHGGGATESDESVFTRVRHSLLEHFLRNEAFKSSPALRSLVKSVIHSDSGVFGSSIEQILDKNIVFRFIGKQEAGLSLVSGVAEDSLNNLIHGSDTSSTSYHSNFSNLHVSLSTILSLLNNFALSMTIISESSNRTRDSNGITNFHLFKLGGQHTTIREFRVFIRSVNLDNHFEGALLISGRGGGILSLDFFTIRELFGGDLIMNNNVVANSKAEGDILFGEIINKEICIMGELDFLGKGDLHCATLGILLKGSIWLSKLLLSSFG
mmetsp:Transcript_11009/g.9457  ORF Transcript_11009/g.9457 Transcript_11009/m.9457 type:complete len:273 (+) Transcript_11009:176-994(+)